VIRQNKIQTNTMYKNKQINLYDIQIQAKTSHIFYQKKEYKIIKMGLMGLMVFTVAASVIQAGSNLGSKQSFADKTTFSTSSSSLVKIIK
jgi:hypothetical protein